jgi:hypothetical protein
MVKYKKAVEKRQRREAGLSRVAARGNVRTVKRLKKIGQISIKDIEQAVLAVAHEAS